MDIKEFIKDSNPVIKRLARKYIFNEKVDYIDEGWIKDIRLKFDWHTHTWGKSEGSVSITNGIYDPWWTSTFYTLLDLMTFEADPAMTEAKLGLKQVLHYMWNPEMDMENDLCVIAMMLRLVLYFDATHPASFELINVLCNEQKEDGGWNCESSSHKGSFHTTLSVLEAYRDFSRAYPTFKHETIVKQRKLGELYLMSRNILYKNGTHNLIFSGIDEVHFPVRWRYDYLRSLEYFASVNVEPTSNFDDAIKLLKYQFITNKMSVNITYPGNVHFVINEVELKQINSIRALQVFSWFDPMYNQDT